MNRNDILWKSILEDIFEDFLRFFYPEADKLFDFTKEFVYLDKELEQLFPPDEDQYSPRYVDKLVKVYTLDGDEEWILVHIEVTVKAALKGKKLEDQDLFALKMQLARRLLSSKVSKYKIGKLLDFLKLYVRIGNTDFNDQFETEFITLKRNTAMGMDEAVLYITREEALEEGIEKGRTERNTIVVQNLLRETSFSIEQIAHLVDVSVEFVQEVKNKS